MKERRAGGRVDDPSWRLQGRAAREADSAAEDAALYAFSEEPRLRRLFLDGIGDAELAQKLKAKGPCKVTRVELEVALAEQPRLAMSPAAALSYAKWILSSERGWSAEQRKQRGLREQLVVAAERGESARELLASSDPRTAAPVLRELHAVSAAGPGESVLRLVARTAGEEVAHALRQGGEGAPLSAELAERLSPHVGAAATGAARLHTGEAAELIAGAHQAHAVTVGEHIFFGRGEYAPGTEAGDDLLVHELTHVAQGQRGELHRAAAKGLGSGTHLDPAEAEAELRAKLAVIELHAPAKEAPATAAPKGQPTTPGDRAAHLAAQKQRIALAKQDSIPDAPGKKPPPTAKQAAVDHGPPEMAAPPRAAASGNAYVDALEAPPSKQATEVWAKVAGKATTEAKADQAAFDAALPPMPVVLEGGEGKAAKGGGGAHQPKPKDAPGPKPPAARPTPTPQAPQVSAAASHANRLQPVADKAKMKTEAKKVMEALPTTSPNLKTDPGPAPLAELAGQADPVRATADQQAAYSDGAKALEAEKKKILAGGGAAQVQPKQLDEKLTVPKADAGGAMPELPQVPGMDKVKKWNLPSDVQASFDNVAKPKMDGHVAEAKAQMTQAEGKRDADRQKAVTDSQEKVKKAHADADKQQQSKVSEHRTKIANKQADTLGKQEAEIKKLDKESGTRKDAAIGKVNERIAKDQAKAEADFQEGQRKADVEKQKAEAEAQRQKDEAKKKAEEDKSWWDQLADAVCDAIDAIASALDSLFEAVGKLIGDLLDAVKNAACALIDAARDFVCAALEEFGDWLKSAVTALLGSVFPELAAALNAFIDDAVNAAKAAVNAIADGLKAAVTALCDGLKAAVNAVIAAYRAAVQAAAALAKALVTGDWAAVGKMVLEGILRLLGIDPEAFYALVGKAEDSIAKILDDPGAFVGHLIDAVKLGFQQFGDNFLTHLKDGVLQWLFGTFAQAGIRMPTSFDVAGVFDLTCQVLGLTWPRLRVKVVKEIGEENTERLEFVAGYVEALVTGGFGGLWEKVQQDLGALWDMVIGGAKQWLIEQLVKQAILKIATMWNPVGAIVQLIQTAWNVYCWVKENAQRIFGLVQAVVDSISNIANGNIAGAANYIESSLAKLVPIAISLFANLLGLGGIADKIKDIITKVQAKVDQAIDKLIARVKAMFSGKGKGKGGKDDKKEGEQAAGDGVVHAEHAFSGGNHAHKITTDAKDSGEPRVVISSDPLPAETLFKRMSDAKGVLDEPNAAKVPGLIAKAREQLAALEAAAKAAAKKEKESGVSTDGSKDAELTAKQTALAQTVGQLLDLFSKDGVLIAEVGWKAAGNALRLLVHDVVDELLQLPAVKAQVSKLKAAAGSATSPVPVESGAGMIALGEGMANRPDPRWWQKTDYEMPDGTTTQEQRYPATPVVLNADSGKADDYATVVSQIRDLVSELKKLPGYSSIGQPQVARIIKRYVASGDLPEDFTSSQRARINEVVLLLFGREAQRNRGMTAFGPMSLELLIAGKTTFEETFDKQGANFGGGDSPMSFAGKHNPGKAGPVKAARLDRENRQEPSPNPTNSDDRAIQELIKREIALAESWLRSAAPTAWDTAIFESREAAKSFVREKLLKFYGVGGEKLAAKLDASG